MMEENNSNLNLGCVLCDNTNNFSNWKGSSNKDSGDGENVQSGKLVKSLWILCNVICEGKVDEAERTRVRNITSDKIDLIKSGKLPCDGCAKTLLELFRIQNIFKETQQLRGDIASRIKHVLRTEDVADVPNVKEETVVNDDSEGESDFEFMLPSPDTSLDGNESSHEEAESLSTKEAELGHELNKSSEKVQRENSNSNKTLVHKSSTGVHFSIKECSVVLTRLKIQNSSNGDPEHTNVECVNAFDQVTQERVEVMEVEWNEQKPLLRTVAVAPNNKKTAKLRKLMKYYLVNEELLLLQCTPVKFQTGLLSCLESQCGYIATGVDNSAFEKMTSHVASQHKANYSDTKLVKTCPICEDGFTTGTQLGKHIFNVHINNGVKSNHNLRQVMCEVCRRTVASIDYNVHRWTHKSDSEKLAAVENGDYVPGVFKLTLHDQRLLGVPDESIIRKRRQIARQYSRKLRSEIRRQRLQETEIVRNTTNNPTISQSQKDVNQCKKSITNGRKNTASKSSSTISRLLAKKKAEIKKAAHLQLNSKETPTESNVPKIHRFLKYYYYSLNEELLLLLCTPIKFQAPKLMCLESDCGYMTEGPDCSTFQLMTSHVANEHEMNYSNEEILKVCPICKEDFATGALLRKHIFCAHVDNEIKKASSSRQVMCEICRRTVVSIDYGSHKWTHKSDSEKLAAVKKGDYVPHVRKLTVHDQELLGLWDESIISKRRERSRIYAAKRLREYKQQRQQGEGKELQMQTAKKLRPKRLKLAAAKNRDCIPPESGSPIFEEHNLEVCKATEEVNRKVTGTSPTPINESTAEVDTTTGNCHTDIDENRPFLLIQDRLLYHDGVLIKFTEEEFICQEKNCGMKIERNFRKLRLHVIYGHHSAQGTIHNRECPLCKSQFEEVNQLKCHLVTVHSPLTICPHCWELFPNYEELSAHVKSRHSDTSKVKKKHKKPGKFPRLEKNYRGKYACQSCPMEFKIPALLRAHEVVHIPKNLREKFNCPDCGQKFLSEVAVRYHIDKRHRPELVTKKRVCKFCGRQYHYREGELYRTHLRTHTGETPYVCELCGKRHISQGSLKEHVKTHTNERAFQCEVCGMDYKGKKGLQQHMKVVHKNIS